MDISHLLDEFHETQKNSGDFRPVTVSPAEPFAKGVPTLEKGKYRPVSPMLRARFNHSGRWDGAWLGQRWLSVRDMETTWTDKKIQAQLDVRRVDWDGSVTQAHASSEVSLFGIDPDMMEETYLYWSSAEPEIVVYTGQSERHYANLQEFLERIVEGNRKPLPPHLRADSDRTAFEAEVKRGRAPARKAATKGRAKEAAAKAPAKKASGKAGAKKAATKTPARTASGKSPTKKR